MSQSIFSQIEKVIFEENEPRTLKVLLEDYSHLLFNTTFPKFPTESVLKTILQKGLGKKLDF